MSWREQYQPASFRGVPFSVRSADQSGGRRVALHQYPRRDKHYPEDMGLQCREYQFEALVLGDNYFQARDALIAALEQSGPGLLIHPYRGRMQIQIHRYRCQESTQNGGMAVIAVEFREAGAAAQPEPVTDTATAVDDAASDADRALEDAWPKEWLADKWADYVRKDAGGLLDGALDAIDSARQGIATVTGKINTFVATVQGIKQRVMNLVLAPANLVSGVFSAVRGLRDIAASPMAAFQAYRGMFEYGKPMIDPPGTSPAALAQAANRKAMRRLVRTAAVIAAARAVAEAQPYRYVGPASPFGAVAGATNQRTSTVAVADTTTLGFATFQEAVAAKDEVVAAIRDVMEDADDATYAALRGLVAALTSHINAQRPALGCGGRYTAGATLPSLVLAYRIYGDTSRADELEQRNHIRHPGFVPGGQPIEVIR